MSEEMAAIYEWHGSELRPIRLNVEVRELESLLLKLPEGTYEALRTRDRTRFFRLERHLERGAAGCKALGLPSFQEDELRAGLDAAAQDFDGDAKVRIDFLPHPATELGMRSTVLMSFTPLVLPPKELYSQGVGVYPTRELVRPTPIIKGTAFIAARSAFESQYGDDYEPVMLDKDGYCLEGAMSNFCCFEENTLRTAGKEVLGGITREAILACAIDRGFQVVEEAVGSDQVTSMDEAFLCSSVRGILPVVRFGGKDIGRGQPGPRTIALDTDYEELVKRTAKRALAKG